MNLYVKSDMNDEVRNKLADVRELRNLGWAIVVYSPEEIEELGKSARDLEDAIITTVSYNELR